MVNCAQAFSQLSVKGREMYFRVEDLLIIILRLQQFDLRCCCVDGYGKVLGSYWRSG